MKTRLRAVMRAVLPALALVAGGSVFAQSPAKYEYFTNTSGVRVLVPVGNRPSYGMGNLIWDQRFNHGPGDSVTASGTGRFIDPSNRPVPISATAKIPSASAAAAMS